MNARLSGQTSSSTLVGAVVAILIIGAVATLGYYQFEVAPNQTSTITSNTAPAITCPSAQCANVNMTNAAYNPPPGYTQGAKTTYGFSPDTVTVVMGVNNTVYWTNSDTAAHTATSDTAGIFDSGILNSGGTYQYTFTTPGTYTYHCSLHSWMQGTVIVKAATSGIGSTSTASSSTSTTST